jgi:pilus assembly protein Flp/PilA
MAENSHSDPQTSLLKELIMKEQIVKFLRDEEGATAIEYGLIAGLIAAVIVGVVGDIGKKINSLFGTILDGIGGAVPK